MSGTNLPPSDGGEDFDAQTDDTDIERPGLVSIAGGKARAGDTSQVPYDPAPGRWKALLSVKPGKVRIVKPILSNALVALRHAPPFVGALYYNAFSHVIEVRRPLPWSDNQDMTAWQTRLWNDHDDFMLTEWIQKEAACDISTKLCSDAVVTVAREHEFHPVRQYFESLRWDGTQRLEKWLTTYLGASDDAFTQMVGPKWIISAVARIMTPGCKADCVLILIGEQGQGKSTLLETLVCKAWYTDEIGSLVGGKETSIAMGGKLLVEFSDLEGFHGRSAEELKAFLSRTKDRYRAVYGRYAQDYPRQVIFSGTTNQQTPLKDFTGNRRFWPVKVGVADLVSMERDRDQIWAEAFQRYKLGDKWWLDTPEARALADAVTEESRDVDEWEDHIAAYTMGKNEIRITEILDVVFDKTPAQTTRTDQMRVSSCLQALGWERVRLCIKEPSGERRVWAYRRKLKAK